MHRPYGVMVQRDGELIYELPLGARSPVHRGFLGHSFFLQRGSSSLYAPPEENILLGTQYSLSQAAWLNGCSNQYGEPDRKLLRFLEGAVLSVFKEEA